MSEFLSKEEVKQWRSSLEKITLEEFAARLGKTIEEDKPTNDLVDMVLKGRPVMSTVDSLVQTKGERLGSIAQRAFDREKQISSTPFSVSMPKQTETVKEKAPVKEVKTPEVKEDTLREEVKIVFKKALTDREQMVFEYFMKNTNKIVYAKDLAKLLDLPRDYVYKYIKNLRTKIDGENLRNAESGGFILSV